MIDPTLLASRLDGPESGADNLFTWDSGYGPATLDNRPRLVVVTGPPPPTPPPVPTQDYIVVTSTPTPANVLTAAAIVQTATAYATLVGTPAPTPRSMVTALRRPTLHRFFYYKYYNRYYSQDDEGKGSGSGRWRRSKPQGWRRLLPGIGSGR